MRASVAVVFAFLPACANVQEFVIETPASGTALTSMQERADGARERVAAVRETLASCGLLQASSGIRGDVWSWHDPDHGSDLRVTVRASWGKVWVGLSEHVDGTRAGGTDGAPLRR